MSQRSACSTSPQPARVCIPFQAQHPLQKASQIAIFGHRQRTSASSPDNIVFRVSHTVSYCGSEAYATLQLHHEVGPSLDTFATSRCPAVASNSSQTALKHSLQESLRLQRGMGSVGVVSALHKTVVAVVFSVSSMQTDLCKPWPPPTSA